MTLLGLAGAALLLGLALALVLPGNRARAGVALLTQAVATACVEAVALPVLASGQGWEANVAWSFPVDRVVVVVDPLSAFFLSWSLPMTLVGSIYATGYLAADLARRRDAGPHFALLNLVCVSYLLVYTVQDTVGFLFGWELAALAAWLLVIWAYRDQKTRFAGFNYLVSTHVGLFLLAPALMVLRAQTGATWFAAFAPALSTPGPLRDLAFLLLGAAFALKAAFFPGHTWLPRAHAAAPAHISALMSGVIHKAGIYGFLRFVLLLGTPEPWMGWTVVGFGLVSAVVGGLFSTTQRDLKRLLGYSSTENVGLAATGLGLGMVGLAADDPVVAALGFAGGVLHVWNHAWFKGLLFYAAGAVHHAAHTVDLERLGGLAHRMPRTAAAFAVGGVAIAGLPPLNGFASEFLIYAAAYSLAVRPDTAPLAAVAAIGVTALVALTGALSTFAVVRAFGTAFLGTPRDPAREDGGDPGPAMQAALGAHTVGLIALGVAPPLGGLVVAPVVAQFADPGPALAQLHGLWPPVGLLAGALALAGVAGAWSMRRSVPHVTWGCGYTAATPRMQYTASSFAQPLAEWFAAWMPEIGGVRPPAGLFPRSGGELRSHHPDPVEQRIHEGLGRGEAWITRLFWGLATEPRVVFTLGLLGLLAGLAATVAS